jgi:hypothetical protein
VVTTWYPEVARYEAVLTVATSHEEFLAGIAAVLEGRLPASAEECRAAVADSSWDVRTEQLRRLGEG